MAQERRVETLSTNSPHYAAICPTVSAQSHVQLHPVSARHICSAQCIRSSLRSVYWPRSSRVQSVTLVQLTQARAAFGPASARSCLEHAFEVPSYTGTFTQPTRAQAPAGTSARVVRRGGASLSNLRVWPGRILLPLGGQPTARTLTPPRILQLFTSWLQVFLGNP
jgi:hypothetical protein